MRVSAGAGEIFRRLSFENADRVGQTKVSTGRKQARLPGVKARAVFRHHHEG